MNISKLIFTLFIIYITTEDNRKQTCDRKCRGGREGGGMFFKNIFIFIFVNTCKTVKVMIWTNWYFFLLRTRLHVYDNSWRISWHVCTHHIISPKYICILKRSVHSVLLDEQNNWYALSVGVRMLLLVCTCKSHSTAVKCSVN